MSLFSHMQKAGLSIDAAHLILDIPLLSFLKIVKRPKIKRYHQIDVEIISVLNNLQHFIDVP